MRGNSTLVKILTIALVVAATLPARAYISSPTPGNHIAGGNANPIDVSGGNFTFFSVAGSIDAKTNSGTLLASSGMWISAGPTDGRFWKTATDWHAPQLVPGVGGGPGAPTEWPTGGTYVLINAWCGATNLGSTYVIAD